MIYTRCSRRRFPYSVFSHSLHLPHSSGMADCIPPPAENQPLGARQSLYSSLSLSLALRGGAIMRAPARIRVMARWLSLERRRSPDGPDQIPVSLVPGLLDPERVAAAAAALSAAIAGRARWVPALTQRRAESSDSDSSGADDDDDDHPCDGHVMYPLIQALDAGASSCLFLLLPASAGSAPGLPGAPQGGGVFRLSDVHENPWILKLGAEAFPGPCELTNRTTRACIMRLKITTKLVCLSEQQLHEQNWKQCFSEVAGQTLEQLLVVACLICDARWSDAHISQMLTVFDALVDVLFNIKGLHFSRSGEVAGIGNEMVNAFKGVIQRTSNDIRKIKESTIHPATFVLIQVLEFFGRNKDMVQSILESGDYNTGPCSDMVNCLVSKLEECAKTKFQEEGRRYIFVLNNIYYVLQKNFHSGLLPPSVVSNLVLLADQNVKSYLKKYWFPPMLLYLDGDSLTIPCRSSMDKFLEIFSSICDSQSTWKVQTRLKGILREEIVKLIVPKYVKFLKALQESRSSHGSSWVKGMWPARTEKLLYTAVELEQDIRRLFER